MLRILILICCFFRLYTEDYPPAISVFATPQELGQKAAERIVACILEKQKKGESPIVLGFVTGNSPIPIYDAFKKLVKEYNLDLSEVISFNLDEYLDLPKDHAQSYAIFMYEHLFKNLLYTEENQRGIKRENIHIPKGTAATEFDLSDEELSLLVQQFPKRHRGKRLTQKEQLWIATHRAKEYESLIQQLGPIDLQILGIGRNGHIGFVEPGTPFSSETSVVKLTDKTRSDNATFFNGSMKAVPKTMSLVSYSYELIKNRVFVTQI